MNIIYLVSFLVFVAEVVVAESDDVSEQEDARRRMIERLSKNQTVIMVDYDLVTRTSASAVFRYRFYRSVAVLYYPIPTDVSNARFTFEAEEVHLNAIGSCEPKEVIIHLKHGSFPAVNPDGYSFPKDFINPNKREIRTIEMLSNAQNKSYSIENPQPGNWYGIAYLKWEDPNSQKVEQQGLHASCQTILYTDLQVKSNTVPLVDCYADLIVNYTSLPGFYKCMSSDDTGRIYLRVTIDPPDSNIRTSLKVQALSLPSKKENLAHCYFDSAVNHTGIISFQPHPLSWHYIQVEPVLDNTTEIAECESYSAPIEEDIDNHTFIDLMRDIKGIFFSFDYSIPSTDLQDSLSLINLTANEMTTLRFDIEPILDVGGTLTIAASMLMSLKYYMGYKRPFRFSNDSLLVFSEKDQFYKVVICMDIGHHSIPLESGLCKYNDATKPAMFVLNSTDSDTIDDTVVIPFPDSGKWYITMRLFCDDSVCPCETSNNGSTYYVQPDYLESKQYREDCSLLENSREGSAQCNASLMFSVSSMPCVMGQCNRHGTCLFSTSGGMVMSSCSCHSGYGGWDCSDDSRMDSYKYMLVSVLLLTLSNLLFFLSMYVAIVRLYYTEALMYTFTMVLSTFYHACDAPPQLAYCIVRVNILQFGDFYCGLMSFWVTLLAMSIIHRSLRSVLQLMGAVVIALLTTWNMQALLAFIMPVGFGVTVVLYSWALDYKKTKTYKFPRSYYVKYLPIGITLVSVGLVCYAFLQTEQNYRIVHSIWHMIIALSVVCLLPDVKRGSDNVNAFLPKINSINFSFCKVFKRS